MPYHDRDDKLVAEAPVYVQLAALAVQASEGQYSVSHTTTYDFCSSAKCQLDMFS